MTGRLPILILALLAALVLPTAHARAQVDERQTVRYSVPSEKDKALASFSGELVVSGDHKELTVRGDDESRNYLTINLADDIVQGKRGPAGARLFYANVSELRESGKSSPYLERLLFIPDPSAAKPRF